MARASHHLCFNRLALVSTLGLSASFVGCAVDVSSLTQGYPAGVAGSERDTAGSAGALTASGGSLAQSGAGQGGQAAAGAPVGSVGGTTSASSGSGGSAGALASAGAAGSAGSAPTCVSMGPEVCNGRDDNCDGTVDEGCPATLAWTLQQDRPQLGDSTGGSYFGEQCAAGEVLTGIKAAFGLWLDQLTGVCSSFEVKPDTSKTPYTYQVLLSSARDLSPHPETTSSAVAPLSCPENQALVGLRIAQQTSNASTVIPRIWISCAALTLSKGASGYGVAWQSAAEIGPLSGSYANDTAWFEQDTAPTTQAPVRLIGASGFWVDRTGFATGTLSVVLQ
jgi:hypothetical protein